MKFILSFLIVLCCSTLYCQSYSSEISDNEISTFFLQLKNSEKLKIKKIDEKIIKWEDDDIYGEKEGIMRSAFGNGILENEIVLKHLTKDDIQFIKKQYLFSKASVWRKKEFRNFTLIDSLGKMEIHEYSMKGHRKMGNHYSYSFSTPLFSIDKNYVIIIQEFYCGFMCSTRCMYLYHNNEISDEWEEIASWNCWST